MDIAKLQGKLTLEEAIHVAFDIVTSKRAAAKEPHFELNSPTQGLRIYSRSRVSGLVDVKRTIVTGMTPETTLANGEVGWSFTVEEIIANDAADPDQKGYDVTVVTSCVVRVYGHDEDEVRDKVKVDGHVRALIRHHMRENGIEITDVQEEG